MKNILRSYHLKFNSLIPNLTTLIKIFIISSLIIIPLLNCANHENDVLAIIGKRTVTVDDFVTRYKSIRQKMNLPDNGQIRKEIFRNIINEELFIVDAVRRGYHDDLIGKYENERLKIQELLNAYLQKIVFHDIPINEEELKTLYMRLNTKIKAHHLYAASQKQADSLYMELMNGKSFEELAKENFKDTQLRDTGGSLGYFTVDEMDPFFEEAAFALEIGQISRPVRTAQGYSIIQVQDRITKPLLTESEYAKHRSKLENYWRYRKKKRATQLYVDSLRQHLNITFNKPVIHQLWQFLKKNKVNTPIENNNFLHHDDLSRNEELVRSKIGIWDVQTFHKYAKFTSEEQHKWIRKKENLEDFIAGLVVRAFILSKAKDLGLHKLHTYEIRIKQKMDDYLLKRMEQTVFETTIIPEDTLRTFFQQNQDQFSIPPKIHLSEIVLEKEAKTNEIKNQLLNNESFEKLAREHSVRRWSADKDGDIGTFTYKELDSYADRLFPLEVGQWVGPIKIGSQYAFFKCIGKYPKRVQSFDEARSEIEKGFRLIWQKKRKQDMLEEIRTHVKIVTYPKKLKSIRLN